MEVDKKRGYASVGVGGILETSASSLEFFCEPKMIEKSQKVRFRYMKLICMKS